MAKWKRPILAILFKPYGYLLPKTQNQNEIEWRNT